MKSGPRIVFLDAGTLGRDFDLPDFHRLGHIRMFEETAPEQTAERIRDADIVLTSKVLIGREHLAAAGRLKYIGSMATGYNQIDVEAASERGIVVTNVPGYSTESVVQHTFALILALSAGLCEHAGAVAAGEWAEKRHFSFWNRSISELHGKTMGLIGFGAIGQGVGRVAHAFGMAVLVYTPRPRQAPDYATFAYAGLTDVFSRSDVVSLHCPLTPDNAGLVNTSLLGLMKKTALFINCARGGLVNEDDLAGALHDGRIAGAGLDVVSVEPMPNDNPLRLAPNCLITPHLAWASLEARKRLAQIIYDNIQNFINGRPSNVCNARSA